MNMMREAKPLGCEELCEMTIHMHAYYQNIN